MDSLRCCKKQGICEVCTAAKNMGAPLPSTTHDQESLRGFVQDGFSSWPKALERFQTHEKSNLHRVAVSTVAATNAGVNVAAAISAGNQKQMSDARTALLAILSSLQYLSCQGLAIRGSTDEDSNLIQLLHLRAQDIPEFSHGLHVKRTSGSHMIF